MSARTLFEKVWDAHLVRPETPEAPAILYADLHLVHEVTSPQAFTGLREKKLGVRRPERTVATMDHSIPTTRSLQIVDDQAAAQLAQLEINCRQFGIELFGMESDRRGIVHVIGPELGLTQPGMTVVCGDSRTGETAKYDGIYYLIHYLRRWPVGLTLLNIGNRDVCLNLVPVDFVVEAMAALAMDDRAIGATIQLADPAPLTTHELFNEISKAIGGRDSFATVPAGIVYPVLRLPFAPKITGLPHSAVPYFFLDQTYDTTRAHELLEPHGIRCPRFPDYVEALVNFVAEHPTLG